MHESARRNARAKASSLFFQPRAWSLSRLATSDNTSLERTRGEYNAKALLP